jgi:phosphatidylinositol glycan class O
MSFAQLALLLWACAIHLSGIYLFTRGFLLTRLSLPNISTCADCALNSTHTRAIVLLIDSLRFDFITPHPPHPPSPYHHNVLTLPRDLTATRPRHSFIFNAYSDPPTTTLQRIKGITTGSLPTFVDIGNNFGGSEVAEDSILKQLKLVGKKVLLAIYINRFIFRLINTSWLSWAMTPGSLFFLPLFRTI